MKLRFLLLALFCALSLPGRSDPPNLPKEALRVMSFNVRNSGAKDGGNDWKSRKALFEETIRKFDPDLLGLQEVLADQHDEIEAMFPDYTMVGVARDDGIRQGEWSAILYRTSRFEPHRSGNFWLSNSPEEPGKKAWDAACVRICTWTALKDRLTGGELLHANTHFDHVGTVARINSSKLIGDRLSKLAGNEAAVILTGDFNCTEDDAAYKLLTDRDDGLTLADSYREIHAERSPDEASFHGFKPLIAGSRIDWILHTVQYKALDAGIIRSQGSRQPSDHYPVTAILQRLP
ncbi:MAG: Endonuclease/Exonuclease/phosphatase family protein [Chthoniobacteraceae bacterium]|nr:Endonuclease/Exonuclease/phosphatase family protein [Chthoniobacteraceae bacterium]